MKITVTLTPENAAFIRKYAPLTGFTPDELSNWLLADYLQSLEGRFSDGSSLQELIGSMYFKDKESGTDAKRDLVLRQRPLIMDFDKDETQFPLVLAHDVTKFTVQYMDPKTGDWLTDWVLTNQLPTEVMITVGLGHLDQYSTQSQDEQVGIVAIPVVSVQPQWQTGGGPGQNPNGGGQGINLNLGGGNGTQGGQKAVQLKMQ